MQMTVDARFEDLAECDPAAYEAAVQFGAARAGKRLVAAAELADKLGERQIRLLSKADRAARTAVEAVLPRRHGPVEIESETGASLCSGRHGDQKHGRTHQEWNSARECHCHLQIDRHAMG